MARSPSAATGGHWTSPLHAAADGEVSTPIFPGLHPRTAPAGARATVLPEGARFEQLAFANEAGTRHYKLYIPASFAGQPVVKVRPEALTLLAKTAFRDVSHLLRTGHLKQLRAISPPPELCVHSFHNADCPQCVAKLAQWRRRQELEEANVGGS